MDKQVEGQVSISVFEYERLKRLEKDYYSDFDFVTVSRLQDKIDSLRQELEKIKAGG